MKILLDKLLEIQNITDKQYDVVYSNNAEQEFVFVYEDVLENIMDDLLDCIDGLKNELKHSKEELDDVIDDRDTNYRRIPISEQVCISDKDFM